MFAPDGIPTRVKLGGYPEFFRAHGWRRDPAKRGWIEAGLPRHTSNDFRTGWRRKAAVVSDWRFGLNNETGRKIRKLCFSVARNGFVRGRASSFACARQTRAELRGCGY